MTFQQIRALFWETHPHFPAAGIGKDGRNSDKTAELDQDTMLTPGAPSLTLSTSYTGPGRSPTAPPTASHFRGRS
jgi:hypothetical protein